MCFLFVVCVYFVCVSFGVLFVVDLCVFVVVFFFRPFVFVFFESFV